MIGGGVCTPYCGLYLGRCQPDNTSLNWSPSIVSNLFYTFTSTGLAYFLLLVTYSNSRVLCASGRHSCIFIIFNKAFDKEDLSSYI